MLAVWKYERVQSCLNYLKHLNCCGVIPTVPGKFDFKGIFIRFAIKWFENGDYIQAAADQRAADHLPSLPAPAADVLCHCSL